MASNQSISFGPPLPEPAVPLWQLLTRHAASERDRTAVHSVHQSIRWSYDDLVTRTEAVAKAWHAMDVTGSVAVLLSNCAEFSLSLFVAARLGLHFTPLDPKSSRDVLKHYLDTIRPDVIVAEEGQSFEFLDSDASNSANVRLRIVVKNHGQTTSGTVGRSPDEKRKAHWTTFEELLSERHDTTRTLPSPPTDPEDVSAICFTSGTTSKPKACPHTGVSLSAMAASMSASLDFSPERKSLCHIPPYHIYGLAKHIVVFYSGASTIYVSPTFDAGASLEAMTTGLCTDAAIVPAMYRMLKQHPSYQKGAINNMVAMACGGSMISPEFVEDAKISFNAEPVPGFGMTESMGITVKAIREDIVHDGLAVGLGKPGYGVILKVCEANSGSQEPLAQGSSGELHISGPSVINGYLSSSDKQDDSFYIDQEGRRWFRTGDQARLGTDGTLYILGRFKDVIIRGGVNIAPASIEAVLNKLDGVNCQVVGVPTEDEAVGEEPCAIITKTSSTNFPSFSQMQQAIRQSLGPSYLLGCIVNLSDLGLNGFPTTSTGKVKKDELRSLAAAFLKEHKSTDTTTGLPMDEDKDAQVKDIRGTVIDIWSEILATPARELELEIPILQLIDSLTLARVRVLIRRRTGKDVPIDLLACEGGIEEQARIVTEYDRASTTTMTDQSSKERDQPPGLSDVFLALGSAERYNQIQRLTKRTLQSVGLDWNMVQEIFPLLESKIHYLAQPRPDHSSVRLALWMPGYSQEAVHSAFEEVIASWPILRSFTADADDIEPFYIQVKSSQKLMKLMFSEHTSTISNEVDLGRLCRTNIAMPSATVLPGPHFKVCFVPVDPSDTTGSPSPTSAAIVVLRHTVFDAISLEAILDDLRAVLSATSDSSAPASRVSHTPASGLSNYLYDMRLSASATTATQYWVDRYADLAPYASLVWPRQRCPGVYNGPDADTPEYPDRKHMHLDGPDGSMGSIEGAAVQRKIPSLQALQKRHRIAPAAVLKAAMAAFLASKASATAAATTTATAVAATAAAAGAVPGKDLDTSVLDSRSDKAPKLPPKALFRSILSGRTEYPFVPASLAQPQENPMEIEGAFHVRIADPISVNGSLSILEFVKGVAARQDDMNRFAHAPQDRVRAAVSEGVRKTLEKCVDGVLFNWLPPRPAEMADGASDGDGTKDPSRGVKIVTADRYYTTMFFFNAWQVAGQPDMLYSRTYYDDCQLSRAEVEGAVGQILDIVEWMCEESNWERTVGEVVAL